MELQFQVYNEDKHLSQLVVLEQNLWNGKTEEELRRIFHWKFSSHTLYQNAFVALDGDKLVGFRGFFINNYTDGKKIFPVAILADAVTDPEYRGKGIFSKLSLLGIEYLKKQGILCILALSSNKQSSPGYLKLGWQPIVRKEIRLRPIWLNIIPLKGIMNRRFICEMKKEGICVVYTQEISSEFARKLELFCRDNIGEQYHLLKDYSFWKYRYAAPHLNYRFVFFMSGEKIIGYVCYMECISDNNSLHHVKILDISGPEYLFAYLIRAVELNTSCKLMTVYATSLNDKLQNKICKSFIFRRIQHDGNASDFIMVKSVMDTIPQVDLTDNCLWDLSYIDLDCM